MKRSTCAKLFIAITLFVSMKAFAEPLADTDPRLKSLMHTFYAQLITLKPYLASDEKMKSPEGKKQVTKSLAALSAQLKKNPPDTIDKAPGFRITYNLIASHIEKTQEVFNAGQMEYSRMRLNAITNFCVHCHSQIPEKSKGLLNFGPFHADTSAKTFENAEFLFVTRQFQQALAQFDDLARKYPKSGLDADRLTQLYRRKLAIFARVYRDSGAAITNLKEDLKNTNLPEDVKRNLEAWILVFENIQKEKSSPEKMTDEQLVAFVEKNIPQDLDRRIAPDHSQAVSYLRYSGLLFERLLKSPESPLVPRILYSLAICEKNASEIYWYPMSEIYLKECVQKYPKTDIAKKCFKAYEKSMLERSESTSSAEQIKLSIEALKKYL